ncbi:conserved hypothetical protein [Aspergillus fumigatus A1163]|uniref:Uncharacterized protein n=1 Tax=Aspergillus fumigatus (strain CBS 144.89 / FGSC A1163 / CEA10) TaxID=451804 RepID=B0XNA4_ASPFC|nr:conserved hypothetical protein [Aspergillus fumigatus A1163]
MEETLQGHARRWTAADNEWERDLEWSAPQGASSSHGCGSLFSLRSGSWSRAGQRYVRHTGLCAGGSGRRLQSLSQRKISINIDRYIMETTVVNRVGKVASGEGHVEVRRRRSRRKFDNGNV